MYSLKQIKEAAPYLFLLGVITVGSCYTIVNMLTTPLTSSQMNEIRTKVTAYNLEFVSTSNKELLGCGSGHSYRVPIIVKNKEGQQFTINYCAGSFFTPSQIKI